MFAAWKGEKLLREYYDNAARRFCTLQTHLTQHSHVSLTQVVRRCNAKKDINILLPKILQFLKVAKVTIKVRSETSNIDFLTLVVSLENN